MRIRFSLRALLIGFALFSAVLAFSLRFGPHLYWRIACANVSKGVEAIPTRPLVAPAAVGDLVTCHVGPFRFELPRPMSQRISVSESFVVFDDGQRSLIFGLPRAEGRSLQGTISGHPHKAALSFPRLYKEICEASSSDFSFGMTHNELRWHQWLLRRRSEISIDVRLLEYSWESQVEGNLLTIGRTSPTTYQWATVDSRWQGMIYFKDAPPGNAHWIRKACATLTLDSDPGVLWDRDEATIKSLVQVSERIEKQ